MYSNTVILRGMVKGIRTEASGKSGTIMLLIKTLNATPVDDGAYEALSERLKGTLKKDELMEVAREYEKLHEQERKVCHTNYPVVNFNADTKNVKLLKTLRSGDRVEIEAHLGVYMKADGLGRIDERVFIYADSIKKDVSKFEAAFGKPGRVYEGDANDVYASGRITAITERTNSLEFKVGTPGNENRPLPFVFYRPSNAMKKEFSIGDKVNILAAAQSVTIRETDEDGKRPGRDFHRFVISTITKK